MGELKYESVDIKDYLAIEQEDRVRYEYHYGLLIAMAGGSISHTVIGANILVALSNSLDGKNCRAFSSEMKVEIKAKQRYVYPDAGIVCPDFQESNSIKGAITNPTVVVEVLSPGSVNYDRDEKMQFYTSLPSVRDYLIVRQDRPVAQLHSRTRADEPFAMQHYMGLESKIFLPSVEVELAMAKIYDGVTLDPPPKLTFGPEDFA